MSRACTYRNLASFALHRRLWTLATFVVALSRPAAAIGADRADWMADARWGVMTHYLADWQARARDQDLDPQSWNEMVGAFDVDGLAEQVRSAGAGYVIFTIGQNSGYYAAPNAVYDELVGRQPSRCSRRDLIADLAAALQRRGVKLIAYLPAGAPAGDRDACRALSWQDGAHRNEEFQRRWERVIRAWSERWGDSVAGWWFDGCYWPNAMYRTAEPPNFESFAAAARAGNPRSAIAFNPGVVDRVISVTPFEDYAAGEVNDVEITLLRRVEDGRVDGARVHRLSYLGREWGGGSPRYENLDEIAIPWTRRIIDAGGAMTWDVPVEPNGLIAEPFVAQLRKIGEAVGR